jgi:Acetyltransferases, including N-acetylases of ribosomal proteins
MITVRPARLPDDKPAILRFIDGLQRYEAEFESDRRLDPTYPEDQFAAVQKQAENGVFLIAEMDGEAVGWAAIYEHMAPTYVVEEERRCAVICEAYVEEAVRGQGAGRALLSACEAWARGRGLPVIHIGHLSQNERAAAVYEKAGFAPYVQLLRKKLH